MYKEIYNLAAKDNGGIEVDLSNQFSEVCKYLVKNPKNLSWRAKVKPDLSTSVGVRALADKFISGYLKSDTPSEPGTTPDEMVSVVMQSSYGYSEEDTDRIKIEHQHSMCAENCVGALLERYMDSVMRIDGWVWCCGDFVKAIDFIKPDGDEWIEFQVKNRNNSENSSSSAIRKNTKIVKWFRTFSKTGNTNWPALSSIVGNESMNEESFIEFVREYLGE